jgi:hypothetical protein
VDTDIHKQRRNLIGVSLGLVIFELSNGKTDSVSFLGGGVKLENGQSILVIAYMALAYLVWRYWLYAKPLHKEFHEVVKGRILASKSYNNLITPLVNEFKNNAGVAYKEGWDAAYGIETEEKYNPIPVNVSIKNGVFSRQLQISVENPMGEYHPDMVTHKISFLTYEAIRIKAYLSAMAADKTFSDMFVPYGLSIVAVAAATFRVLHA